MTHDVTPVIVNGELRTMLIYKSETPMTFDDPGVHRFTIEDENSMVQEAYITSPVPYQEITPEQSNSGDFYFYWFLVNRVERTTIVTNEEKIKQLEADFNSKDLDNKMALAEVYEMMLGGASV